MENRIANIGGRAAEFMGLFHRSHVILFAGKGTTDEMLENGLATLPWSCVITSRTDRKFSDFFCADYKREVKELYESDKLPARPLNKQGDLNILRIHGLEGQFESLSEDQKLWYAKEEDFIRDHCDDMLQILPGILDGSTVMVVVGYGYAEAPEGELPCNLFGRALAKTAGKEIQFWGIPAEKGNEQLQRFAEGRGYAWFENPLKEVVDFWRSSGNEEEEEPFYSGDETIFYKAGKAVSLSANALLPYRNIAELLSEQSIPFRPYGRIQQARWYYHFLTLSSESPQWYGYLKSSNYYVERSYEKALVDLVTRQLNGSDPANDKINHPVILHGEPGSSKSITLAALAQKIYHKTNNPVLFIKNDTLVFSNDNSETKELDRLMELIDSKGEDARILLIWDSSSYRNIAADASRLARFLSNRGRRFVLVCSAYEMDRELERSKENKAAKKQYFCSEKNFAQCAAEQADVTLYSDCYYIKASRELNDSEKYKLWQKFSEFSDIPKEDLNHMRRQLADINDIFECFYKIISVLRPNLESALTREEQLVNDYVSDQLSQIDTEIQKSEPEAFTLAEAFRKAGLDFSSESSSDRKDPEKENSPYDLHRFNCCIAMFSRFKIEVPYSMAMQMLKKEGSEPERYVSYNQELFKVLSTQIPWLRYGESKDGNDYTFRFRNALEADLFLVRNEVKGEQQVKILCDILKLYGIQCKNNHYLMDAALDRSLQQLVRLMGPNSQYPAFHTVKKYEHKDILRHLEDVIDTLEMLFRDYKIPDRDASFAFILVTFMREYYGNKWDSLYGNSEISPEEYTPEKYLTRIKKLQGARNFALDQLKKLELKIADSKDRAEKKHLTDQHNGMTVEMAWCDFLMKKYHRNYQQLCKEAGIEVPAEEKEIGALRYRDVYQNLVNVILNAPANGHAYNILFNTFETMYDTEKEQLTEKERLQYLSEIKLIADDSGVIDPRTRGADGRDEIGEHIQKIRQYSIDFPVTIKAIQEKTMDPEFAEMYQRMLEDRYPSAVTFVCQKELDQAGISTETTALSENQKACCERVRAFMQEEQNRLCIGTNYYALNLLLRVTWMCYTGRSMKSSPECQTVGMDTQKWREIREISGDCCDAATQHMINRAPPLVVLIHALATLQETGDFQAYTRIIRTLEEGQFLLGERRMFSPFMFSDETGTPYKYSGIVRSTDGQKGGIIEVDGVSLNFSGKPGVRFYLPNFGKEAKMPAERTRVTDLELGIGFTGLSLYKEAGRRERGEGK